MSYEYYAWLIALAAQLSVLSGIQHILIIYAKQAIWFSVLILFSRISLLLGNVTQIFPGKSFHYQEICIDNFSAVL